MDGTLSTSLSDTETEAFGAELDRIRAEIIAERGESDARYIRKVIAVQRTLEVGGRAALLISLLPPAWAAGTVMLTTAKILDNMEIGHNVMHGQWDWMRDPRIHSSTWEWDALTPAAAWKQTHNNTHHRWTNVIGRDRDVGYTVMRMSEDQPWKPRHLAQPVYNAVLAPLFEWGIALFDLELDAVTQGRKSRQTFFGELGDLVSKAGRQLGKDYVLFPLLAGPSALPCLLGNLTAVTTRNLWTHAIIFCGHFPDGAQTFREEETEGETRGGWYLRQLLGSANIEGGPLFHVLSGNLGYQIEHHLFPDLPSNRYARIAPRVRELCGKYRLPYTTGPFGRQYREAWKRVWRLALPWLGPVPGSPAPDGGTRLTRAAVAQGGEPRDIRCYPVAR